MFSTSSSLNVKDIVIIGDGPSALIAAIKLKQKGITNVTLVGPHLDSFSRSGDFIKEVFKEISLAISPLTIQETTDRHIKDVERQLYVYAKELGVTFIKKKFVGFAPERDLILGDVEENSRQLLHADLVLECTGTKRAVINEFNKRTERGPRFAIKHFSELPVNQYAMVRVIINASPYDFPIQNTDLRPIDYVTVIEKLRALGWEGYQLPLIHVNTFPKNKDMLFKMGDRKGTLYFEVPPKLNNEQIIAFGKLLISLVVDEDVSPPFKFKMLLHKPSNKFLNKPVITTFPLDCYQTSPAFYTGDEKYPLIFHIGDATANVPFFTSQGLRDAIKRINGIFDSIHAKQGVIDEIDFQNISKFMSDSLSEHEKLLDGCNRGHQEFVANNNNHKELVKIYQSAYQACIDEYVKAMILRGLKAVSGLSCHNLEHKNYKAWG